ncbi:MAG: chemotaxis protein CheA, partial [Spirochaetota bacterium]|nr:chemotaxis protein CheA [Spirochaetota bacterium]
MGAIGIKEIFIEEADEILNNLESDIVSLEEENNPEIINRVFRYMHTLKGSSGIAGFNEISEFTHKVENLLDRVRGGELEVKKSLIDILLGSIDWVKLNIFNTDVDSKDLRDSLIDDILHYSSVNEEIESIKTTEEADTCQDKITGSTNELRINDIGYNYFHIKSKFKEDIFEFGIDPLMLIEDLSSLGRFCKNSINRNRFPNFEEFNPEKCYLDWDIILKTRHPQEKIDDVFLFVKDDNEIDIQNITSTYIENEKDNSYVEVKRLGDLLLRKGIITSDELNDVLAIQDEKNHRIGDIIIEKGYATENDVKVALHEQEKIKIKIESSTVRVDTRKLDALMNLLGEIVIGQSALTRISEELDEGEESYNLKNTLYGLDRTTREFQEQIMSIRMIPIGATFEQFRRFVRDSSKAFGKDIKIEIRGKDTELDKTVIEKIGDPLKHMIRNAIDHGIESSQEREKAGKDKTGHIILQAYHQEGNVYIEILDDGRGIDKEKVKEKACEMGLIKPNDEISDEKILSFLFAPGLSTAERVGDLSGRGVGMDVVKTNIDELRGTVQVETTIGKGTTFRIKLPL